MEELYGWTDYDFAVIKEMLLNTYARNNQPAPVSLIKSHNDNQMIIDLVERADERRKERIKALKEELAILEAENQKNIGSE